MKKINAIILMAGASCRFFEDKITYNLFDKPLFSYSLNTMCDIVEIDKIILVTKKENMSIVNDFINSNNYTKNIIVVEGQDTRTNSLKQALIHVDSSSVIVHDGARPLVTKSDIIKVINALDDYYVSTLYHPLTDTIKQNIKGTINTIDRNTLIATTTPQGFRKELFNKILNNNMPITDEVMLFEKDYQVCFIKESTPNIKVTTKDDLDYVMYKLTNNSTFRIGHSLDYHNLVENRPLILGGITIPYDKGLQGHSDADVVYHALTEAIIGSLGKGDIGGMFPDTDDKYKDIASSYFVKEAVKLMDKAGYEVENIDLILYIEKPNLSEHKLQIAKSIKDLTNAKMVNVKATTMEKTGVIGNKLGIACECVVLIKRKQ